MLTGSGFSPFAQRMATSKAHIVLDGAGTETAVTQALGSRRYQVMVTGPGGLDESVPVTYENNVNAGLATATASYAGAKRSQWD